MKIPKAHDNPKINPFKFSKCMNSTLNKSNLASGIITIMLEYARAIKSTIINGTFTKNGFFHGLPIVKAMRVKIYMKFVNKNRIFVSGVTFTNYSSTKYLSLLTENPPILK